MLNDIILESVGMYVPEKVVTNKDLVKEYLPEGLITAERIEKSTGISERRFATEKDMLVTMAHNAIWEAVYKAVIEAIGKCIKNVETNGYSSEDIDHFILHQANKKVIRTAQAVYDIPDAKMHMTIEKYGNTSSASIGINWCDALKQGKIKEGDKVMVIGFGAGFRWNYMLVQY